jgi:Fe-S oxidoreductase
VLNPGRIVRAPKFDTRALLRYHQDYRDADVTPALDWSEYPGAGGGLQAAVEMCNNNGTCRKAAGGVMCPSYRVTRDETHVTRGRANTLRLALSGQLGPEGLGSPDVAESMSLCVSCKACRRECPTGVDMARMKIEVQAARVAARGLTWRDRLVGYLPRYAEQASRVPSLMNARDRLPGVAWLSEKLLSLAAGRPLPRWRWDIFEVDDEAPAGDAREVVLWVDTFNRYFERENADAALRVLRAAGYHVHLPRTPKAHDRPLCCGRTFLSVGLVDEARTEARRTLDILAPFARRGVPILGLEPSCLFTFRDEIPALLPGPDAKAVAAQALLIEEFLAAEAKAQRLTLPLQPLAAEVHLHGHCHQKAFGAMGAVEATLRLIPEIELRTIESSCCGMAGSFGYQRETLDASKAMAELTLLPAIRKTAPEAIIVADGTSCRHQIEDGTGRQAVHVTRVLERALTQTPRPATAHSRRSP